MSDRITSNHLGRAAFVYIRQSTVTQLERNRESTDRQYKLADRAVQLGWRRDQVRLIDDDLGLSGSGAVHREGFEIMASEVALGRVGLILAIEVSRLARNNAEWYRLLDFCGLTDTLIGDEDGIYHPGLYNDRLLLGLKGTMSEAELHVLRARLNGGIRNKAARGELQRALPVGFVWGEKDGEVLFDPDEAVRNAIRTVFEKFAEMGSVRQVWIWLRTEKLLFPSRPHTGSKIRWITPTYHAIHTILDSPVYAGVYLYGRSRHERYIDSNGQMCKRVRRLPPSEWQVFIRDHHQGFIDWETYEMNKARIARNTRPGPHQAGGAIREGAALLQGLACCGHCGRKLHVYYQGKSSTPGYYCPGNTLVNGKAFWCLRIGGVHIDRAVAEAFLNAITPAGVEAALQAEREIEADRDAALLQWQHHVDRAQYEADAAERRYRAVEPENRLVARNLETEWEKKLGELTAAKDELEQRRRLPSRQLTEMQRDSLRALGTDLRFVWIAQTTTDRDRKELLQTLLEEVIIRAERQENSAHLTLRWRGGAITELDVARPPRVPPLRTDEDTIELVRRLAPHYSNAVIAGILNRQGRRTVRGERFTAISVSALRQYWNLPHFERRTKLPDGEPVTIRDAATILGVAPSTLHRCLNDGIIVGEQLTPGAPWRIRVTEELRARFAPEAPEGYVPLVDAMRILGVSRQTVLQRVKRGQLEALHITRGRRKGLYVKILDAQIPLFDTGSEASV
ncbi:recombinase family protein [Candidatus Bipolaricaulota bacterium]|nr:recombinase family protein [Candidatus Bipolaricaulota bacterium]